MCIHNTKCFLNHLSETAFTMPTTSGVGGNQNVLDSGGDDGKDNEDQESSQREEVDDEEARLRQAIETEKEVYRTSFTGLRELKSEIEHIQMILEKVCACTFAAASRALRTNVDNTVCS